MSHAVYGLYNGISNSRLKNTVSNYKIGLHRPLLSRLDYVHR